MILFSIIIIVWTYPIVLLTRYIFYQLTKGLIIKEVYFIKCYIINMKLIMHRNYFNYYQTKVFFFYAKLFDYTYN